MLPLCAHRFRSILCKYDYWLGGKDNFAVDRELGEQLRRVYPAIADLARSDRQFLNRAVRYLSTSQGLVEAARQYRAGGAETYHLRGPEQVAGFFAGLDLVRPGVVPVPQWRPDHGAVGRVK